MRIVPCVLVFTLGCTVLAGCGLFRNQSGSDAKRPATPAAQNSDKLPAAPPKDDPLFSKGPPGTDHITSLSGYVFDAGGAPLAGAFVRLTNLDESGKEAPIDLAVQSDGSFTFHGVKKDKHYKLEGRAKQEGQLIAGTFFTTAPNHCPLKLTAAGVTADTPPLPPPPNVPGGLKKDKESDKKDSKKPSPTGWTPEEAKAKSGLSIGAPVPLQEKTPANNPPSGWGPSESPNPPPKYPPNLVEKDTKKPPVLEIKPDGGNAPKPGPQANGGAHVPSCVLVGKKLINFALPDCAGNRWEWQSNRIGKLVLLDFWRTNCPPCREAIDHLRMLQNTYGPAGLQVVGIALEDHGTLAQQRENVARLCQLKQTNYQILMATGPDDPVTNSFGIMNLPTLILLDEQGNILYRHEGADPGAWQAIEQLIQLKLMH